MIVKKITLLVFLFSLIFGACTDKVESPDGKKEGKTALKLHMGGAPSAIISNTQVYLFDGPGASQGQFKYKIPALTYGTDNVSMSVEAGTWDFQLVSAATDITGGLISPVRGHRRSDLKMWKTPEPGTNLTSMPELRMAYLAGQQVVAGQMNQASETAVLGRNVAKVEVVLKEAGGLDINRPQILKLSKVPNTLNWEGGLYPNGNNPDVSAKSIVANFTVHNGAGGIQHSDPLEFIIPAHRGVDYLSSNPSDTTTHHLELSVDFTLAGGTHFTKTVRVHRVPRINGILKVNVIFGGKLDITADILPWKDVNVDADLSQIQLYTNKPAVELASEDLLYVNTNAPDFTVTPGATWITATKVDNKKVKIVARTSDYTTPRESFITLKAGNVEKRIPVKQRPDKGTLKVDKKKLLFAPVSGYTQQTVNITSLGGGWEFVNTSPKATPDKNNGNAGSTPVVFTRSNTNNQDQFDQYYGDGSIKIRNKVSLEELEIDLSNCFIYVEEDVINATAPSGAQQSAVTVSERVKVYGGTRNLDFITSETTSWIHDMSFNPGTQKLTFTTDRAPDDEPRDGWMVFSHKDIPSYAYKKRVRVHQDLIVTIPEFEYFVCKFTWHQADVDIAVRFHGNGKSYDDKAVGWSLYRVVTYNGHELLKWGGDATQGQGETAFFNAPILNADATSPRKIKMEIYATWFRHTGGTRNMGFNVTCYKGGTMVQNGTNFNNHGGNSVFNSNYTVYIPTTQGVQNYANGGYTKVATLIYDRLKHSAEINIHAQQVSLGGPVVIPLKAGVVPDDSKYEKK